MKEAAGKLIGAVTGNWISEEMLNTLRRKSGQLTAIEEDINIQLEIVESSSSNRRRKREVADWLTNVSSVKQEIQNFEAKWDANIWSKIEGKQVKRLTDEVVDLIERRRFLGDLVHKVPDNGAQPLLVTKLVGRAFEDNQKKMWEWVMKDEVLKIGIYGMGGVGKTTLVTHIYNRLLNGQNKFSNVYWITISQDFSIRKLQDRIAYVIQFDLPSEDEERIRAAKLSKALDKMQKSVFILDDLWNQFSIEEVGIPMNCKLIITTRSLDICWQMSCREKMILEPLLEEESWNLFVEKFGNLATLSSEVKEIAKSIIRECDGLPLGIVTLAGSMRGVDDVQEWMSVLEQLKQSIIRPGKMDDNVFKVLNLSYERLKDQALQECFLYCALFPEDFEIRRDVLIEYLINEDIIEDLNSRQAQLNRGHTMLRKLENACLLERSSDYEGKDCVKMHDLIRDMAINKMKVNPKAMVKAGEELKEVPNVIKWSKDLVRVSLKNNAIKKIPEGHSPSCPHLSTLLLDANGSLEFIADSFFFQFCGLKVLDLSYTAIEVLPDSVSNLMSLTSLLLHGCQWLRYIPYLATLKTLKKLDLHNCRSVKVVPRGLELLSNLQYLDMYGTQIKDIPNGLLANLLHLQYLRLRWSTAVDEVKSAWLDKVEHLECRFPKLQHFNSMMKDYSGRPPPSIYKLLIGEFGRDLYDMYEEFDMLSKFVAYSGCDIGKDGDLVRIPEDLETLLISGCHTLRSLDNAFIPDGTRNVEIERCEGVEYLISLYSPYSSTIFGHVMELRLRNLNNLGVLISREGAPPLSFPSGGVFSCLKCCEIRQCPSITSLFPYELLPNLHNLERIKVAGCKKIEQIIGEESNGGSHAEFISLTKLKYLELWNLPELKSICSKKMACDSVESIIIQGCPKLKRMGLSLIQQLDNGQLSPLPSLKTIWIDQREWWDSVESIIYPNAKQVLQPLLVESSLAHSHGDSEEDTLHCEEDSEGDTQSGIYRN